jgi:hypothetical protein
MLNPLTFYLDGRSAAHDLTRRPGDRIVVGMVVVGWGTRPTKKSMRLALDIPAHWKV